MSKEESKLIVGVARIDEHAVLVEYSNNSSATYTAAQLATLVPTEIATEDETEQKDDQHGKK